MRPACLVLPLLLCAMPLAGQAGAPSGGTDEKTLSFGLNSSHGNRDSVSLSAAFDWSENAGRFENELDLDVALTDSLGEDEGLSDDQSLDWTIRYAIGGRAARRWFVLSHLSGERQEYAGLEFRQIAGFGAGRHLVEAAALRLTLEAGAALAWEHPEDRPAERFAMPFLHGTANWRFGDGGKLSQLLQVEVNGEDRGDVRVSSDTELSIRITERLSLRPSVKVRWDDRPIGDAEELDVTTHTSLSFEF